MSENALTGYFLFQIFFFTVIKFPLLLFFKKHQNAFTATTESPKIFCCTKSS